jgi:hypothetical protein
VEEPSISAGWVTEAAPVEESILGVVLTLELVGGIGEVRCEQRSTTTKFALTKSFFPVWTKS